MANAEIDVVKGKVFDKKFEAGVMKTARRVAEKAVGAEFDLGAPKDKKARYWSVDLNVLVTLDSKSQELDAGCGVIVHIKQEGKKFMHASKPPNSAKGKVNAAKLAQADVDGMVEDAVSAAMDKPIAQMKAGSKDL
jgi:hypothetical protein